jgi:hypothetical protein
LDERGSSALTLFLDCKKVNSVLLILVLLYCHDLYELAT